MNRRAALRPGIRHVLALGAVAALLAIAGCSSPSPTTSTIPSPTTASGMDDATTAALQAALDDTREVGGFPGVIHAVCCRDRITGSVTTG